ncbi:MAG: pentapeptide repeat-containing protein, partial [Nitrospiraceae bacterium]|nr:pentapeptide repeat-containing protein [Nitrospiraceae bacterium]
MAIIRNTEGDILFQSDDEQIRPTVEAAVKSGIPLNGADLRNANLDKSNLRGGAFKGANFEGASLVCADLRESTLA